jgi:DNA repair exonuclease SbcCD nuclease subunit
LVENEQVGGDEVVVAGDIFPLVSKSPRRGKGVAFSGFQMEG